MSNAQWGKTWYQAPTEIVRNGRIYHFRMSEQELNEAEHNGTLGDILRNIKNNGQLYRIIRPYNFLIPNSKGELWVSNK